MTALTEEWRLWSEVSIFNTRYLRRCVPVPLRAVPLCFGSRHARSEGGKHGTREIFLLSHFDHRIHNPKLYTLRRQVGRELFWHCPAFGVITFASQR